MAAINYWKLSPLEINYITCTSCLIAAKIEEVETPTVEKLIYKYAKVSGSHLNKDALLDKEREILSRISLSLITCQP